MTTNTIKLHSVLDPSVNTYMDGFETRFVSRDEHATAAIYLSSFKGCDRACRMCHLTHTGQTDMTPATLADFIEQAKNSLSDAKSFYESEDLGAPKEIHYNFMARGEPFLNRTVMDDWEALSNGLLEVASQMFPDANVKLKISTIGSGLYIRKDGIIVGGFQTLPFKVNLPDIYYSLYSTETEFRKRWLPKAEDYVEVLRLLGAYQSTGGRIYIHNAFILGHNDDIEQVNNMINSVKFYGIKPKFNIVRFNSPDTSRWVEPEEEYLQELAKFIESKGIPVNMIQRVGFDVSASCGMFVKPVTYSAGGEIRVMIDHQPARKED